MKMDQRAVRVHDLRFGSLGKSRAIGFFPRNKNRYRQQDSLAAPLLDVRLGPWVRCGQICFLLPVVLHMHERSHKKGREMWAISNLPALELCAKSCPWPVISASSFALCAQGPEAAGFVFGIKSTRARGQCGQRAGYAHRMKMRVERLERLGTDGVRNRHVVFRVGNSR
jgi:hypothetical protein